jgi:transcriptional regulator with XRE-family HTH domain
VEEIAIQLAERVRKLRLQAGLTQAELALGAGVTVETVARLERVLRGRASANANPSLETLSRLATALGVEVVDLLSMSSKAKAKDDRLALVMRGASQQTRRVVLKLAEVLVREQQSNGKATPRSRRPRK